MKKFAALILALLFAAPAALAGNLPVGGGLKATEAPGETGGTDPRSGYEEFVDPADAASVWFLRMIDSANDEIALTADGTAIRQGYFYLDEDDVVVQEVTTYLYLTEYGRVFDVDISTQGYHLYVFPDSTFAIFEGDSLQRVGDGYLSDYPITPDAFLNEYDAAETLVAVRAEGDGFCYLTDLGDGTLFEYEIGADLVYTGYRVYTEDGLGGYWLAVYGDVSLCEAPTLPQDVIDLLGQ